MLILLLTLASTLSSSRNQLRTLGGNQKKIPNCWNFHGKERKENYRKGYLERRGINKNWTEHKYCELVNHYVKYKYKIPQAMIGTVDTHEWLHSAHEARHSFQFKKHGRQRDVLEKQVWLINSTDLSTKKIASWRQRGWLCNNKRIVLSRGNKDRNCFHESRVSKYINRGWQNL